MRRAITSQIFDHISVATARLGRFLDDVAAGLDALHRVQFEEPWKPVRKAMYGEW